MLFRKHSIAIIASVAFLPSAGCQFIPGIVGGPSGDDYYPLIEGAKWEYSVLANTQKVGTMVVTSSLVSAKDGITTADLRGETSLKSTDGNTQESVQTFKVKKMADEIQYTDSKGTTKIEMKLPLTQGLSWVTDGTTYEVKGQEDISVPAGSYRGAWKVVGTQGNTTATNYYANQVGTIKQIVSTVDGTITVELTKFTKP